VASESQPEPGKSVFINCPFDKRYRPHLRSMVFTIIACGCTPRCALDTSDGAEVRLSRIAKLIGECDWAIHDRSRVQVRRGELPRFNMPMELGLHLGAKLFGDNRQKAKRALIMDADRHRYDRMLSDISGQDIEVHAENVDQMIACVRNWLSDGRPHSARPLRGAQVLQREYARFKTGIGAFLKGHRLDPLSRLTHSDYVFAVREWLETRAAASYWG
jgi:hypothetical protein